jgi:glucose/arabinose dehydrogenase
MRHYVFAAILAGLAAFQPAGAAERELYRIGAETCDGYPRAPIDMAKGFCAGLVAGPSSPVFKSRSLRLPRTLLPLGGSDWLVADLGAWVAGEGAIWRLHAEPGKPAALQKLISGLDMPHTLAIGPDGRVYLGEMSRIVTFDPAAADPAATVRTVVSNLPDNRLHEDRHPLSTFVFDGDGALLVNVGAPSDQCADASGKPDGTDRCVESEGAEPAAAIRRYPYLGDGRWSPAYTVLARGLRNSVALVRHPSGALLQAENSYDFDSAEEPYEEINRIEAGRHYGWPYCYDMDQASPVWAARKVMDCASAAHARPLALMTPHAAPLAMLYYHGPMFPALEGRLIMSWHGYRAAGSRLVAFRVDAQGQPIASAKARYPVDVGGRVVWKPYREGPGVQPILITKSWREVKGLRPTGAPVGLAVAADGAIWLADDRNGTILRIAADRP